jgi:hypothetical protein
LFAETLPRAALHPHCQHPPSFRRQLNTPSTGAGAPASCHWQERDESFNPSTRIAAAAAQSQEKQEH